MTKDNIWEIKTNSYINIFEVNRTRCNRVINFIRFNKFPLIFIGTMTLLITTNILLINKFFNLLIQLG